MKNEMIFNQKVYKRYDDMYFVSSDGDIYSLYSRKTLKHYIDKDGYHRVDIHGKHIKVHKLVYVTWIGEVPSGLQINHKNDDKDNNSIDNLYLGTQKENIHDCIKNKHRKGNTKKIVIYDKEKGEYITFEKCKDFLNYSGHTQSNGCFARCLNRNWFKDKYIFIGRCND